jgi:DnaJ-class molecular chaperone
MRLSVLCALLPCYLSAGESQTCSADGACTPNFAISAEGNPYETLGVERSTNQATITKAYRALAKVWHPDRHSHEAAAVRDKATRAFAEVADAYAVLSDPDKRDVYDRLGRNGLRRLQDGDPSVKKGYVPPDEVLRRMHNDGDQDMLDWVVTSVFAMLEGVGRLFKR